MIDKEVAIAALSALCNANVTSTAQSRHVDLMGGYRGAPRQQQLRVTDLVSILDADETRGTAAPGVVAADLAGAGAGAGAPTGQSLFIDEDEFFDPQFDYDFTMLRDSKTYSRGGEKYERPYGWQRFAIKVLGKYSDGNAWLGNPHRSTDSVPGEWPVSYYGTSQKGAAGIIGGFYQEAGNGKGVYSTPQISVAKKYAKPFFHKGKNYEVILQNRINPKYRKICQNVKYWLIPIPGEKSKEEKEKIVHEAIRPYGLLLKEA